MDKEMIINVAPHEKRIALLEDGKLAEIYVERPDEVRTVGNIYKGRVANVLPGLHSAFVDIGLEKAAFLSLSDVDTDVERMRSECHDPDEGTEAGGCRTLKSGDTVRIEKLFRKGQEILVQVLKEPMGTKGARVTTSVSLAGRFLVLVPDDDFIGVSRRNRDREERRRLKQLCAGLKPQGFGVIVRTVGADRRDEDFKSELRDLHEKWLKIKKLAAKSAAPCLLHAEEDTLSAEVRDTFSDRFRRLIVDSKEEYNRIHKYLTAHHPEISDRVFYFSEKAPIFEVFGIEKELERSLRRKVWLKSGGSLIFDYTEAMTVIDVNSGRHTGRKNAEDTLFHTNLEAAAEIARQIRLRDIGGIVAIDFIDLENPAHRKALMDTFEQHLKRDRMPHSLGKIREFGILLMTRKREGEHLFASFSEICEGCGGIGRIFSKASVIAKLDRYLTKIRNVLDLESVILKVNPAFRQYLDENGRRILKDLQKSSRVRLTVEDDRHLPLDQFELWDEARKEEFSKLLSPVVQGEKPPEKPV